MINTLYIVHSDVDENNIRMEFNTKEEAIEYAKGTDDGIADKTWVEAVEIEIDDHGNVVKDLAREKVWSYVDALDDQLVKAHEDEVYAKGDQLDTLEDQGMANAKESLEDDHPETVKEDLAALLFDPAFDTEFSEPCCDVDVYADCNAENCRDELIDNIEGVIKALGVEQEIVDDFTKCEWPEPDDYYKCGEKCCDTKPEETTTTIIAAEVPTEVVDKLDDPEVKVEIPVEGETPVEAPATIEEPAEPRAEVPDTVAEVNDVKPEETEISEISDSEVESEETKAEVEVPTEVKDLVDEIEKTPADENPKDMIDGELVDAKDPTESEVEVEDEKKEESLEEAALDPNDPDLTKDSHAYAYYLNKKLPEWNTTYSSKSLEGFKQEIIDTIKPAWNTDAKKMFTTKVNSQRSVMDLLILCTNATLAADKDSRLHGFNKKESLEEDVLVDVQLKDEPDVDPEEVKENVEELLADTKELPDESESTVIVRDVEELEDPTEKEEEEADLEEDVKSDIVEPLVKDEEEAIKGYEDAKKDLEKEDNISAENKDKINQTFDHIKDEEKEHIDEIKEVTDSVTESVEVSESKDVPVVPCKVNDVITHSEDEKPVDCKGEKKPLEKPLTEENLTDSLDHKVKVTFECPECGHEWQETFDKDYFEDEKDLENVMDTSTTDCPECGCKDCVGKESEILDEDTHNQYAMPEGDKVKAFNNALKYAKKENCPFIYGYTNGRLEGKFFALSQPIKCKGEDTVQKVTAEFNSRYKNSVVVYVAYPDNEPVEECLKEDTKPETSDVMADLQKFADELSEDCNGCDRDIVESEDISDEEFVEEFGKAMIERHDNKN